MTKETQMHYDEQDVRIAENSGLLRADANESIFFARQLEHIRSRTYDIERPKLSAWTLFPVDTSVPAGAKTITYRQYDAVGSAKIIANYADDLPRADVKASETLVKVKDLGDSYGYNIAEMRASEATGANLDVRKATAARRAIDVKVNQMAMVGEPNYGIYGLLNHPNIGTTVLVGGWAAATGDAILADLNTLVNAVRAQSKGVHNVNMIALPLEQDGLLDTKFVANSGGKTVRQVFNEARPGRPITFVAAPELKDAGTAGAEVIIAAERDPDNFSFEMPMPFNQLPGQARNLEIVVPCIARVAGLQVYYPLALTRAEGI